MNSVAGVVGILLASGKGTRFDQTGQRNKLVAVLPDGRAVIRADAQTLCMALPWVVVVVGDESAEIRNAIADLPLEIVHNSHAALGMGTSIAAGIGATTGAHGWVVALGDMPFIEVATIAAVAAPLADDSELIIAPAYLSARGHPVGFGQAHCAALSRLEGDRGARVLLNSHSVLIVPVADSGILRDIDTQYDLEING